MAGEIYPATSGTSGVGARAGIWTVIVTIDGVDQTARVIGDLRIDAEEGAARIADLTIRPPDGQVVTVAAWVGKSITIDIADQSSGSPTDIQRLFSGLIDTPALDLETRTIALRCTDNLQNLVAALDNAAIDALTPGGWHSPAVFDPAATGWGRLQDRLSTRPTACERSIAGALRVTPWAPALVPHLSFTAEHVLDGSLSVALAARHQLVNEVGISFGYRFPRVKAEAYPIAYQYVAEGNLADHAANLNYWLRRDAVVKAIESAGGTVESITYTALPNQQIGQWIPSAVDYQLCMGFSAEVSFDYVQMIEERHTITVAAPASVAAVGTLRRTLQGALEGVYPPTQTVEHDMLLFKNKISSIPPLDTATPLTGYTVAADVTLTPETDRTAAGAAMQTLIEIAKTNIWGSHRQNRVRATVALNPAIDLDKTIDIAAGPVHARGKCVSVSHLLSPPTGQATSELAIALCTIAGTGISHPETPTAAPAGSAPATTPLAGEPTADFNFLPEEDHMFTVTFPGVDEVERAKAIIPLASSYNATLSEDILEVTL